MIKNRERNKNTTFESSFDVFEIQLTLYCVLVYRTSLYFLSEFCWKERSTYLQIISHLSFSFVAFHIENRLLGYPITDFEIVISSGTFIIANRPRSIICRPYNSNWPTHYTETPWLTKVRIRIKFNPVPLPIINSYVNATTSLSNPPFKSCT